MGNNISFDSGIGKDKKSGKRKIIAVVAVIVIAAALIGGYYIYRQSNITEIAVGLSDIELNDELKNEMQNLVNTANTYLNENKYEKTLTSQYGLLYSYKDKINVMAADIVQNSNISKDILAEMDIIYAKPADVISSMEGDELEIFLSVNSSSGYYVVSASGENAVYTEEEFKNILMKYAPVHGDVRNPQRGSDEHTAIIKTAELDGEDIDIKHIACDNKYAVVVGGSISNPAKIKEAALVKEESGWKVVNDRLSASESSYIDINAELPDMDLGLMPVYNIADFGAVDTSDMDSIANSLIELNMMTEADKETMYAAGCGRFAYIQLENGKRLVGYIGDDKKLEFNEADNITETITYMLKCEKNPPVFIARFE